MKSNQLVGYGIQNEESDIRAHVCPKIKRVYVFPTKSGQEAIEKSKNNTYGYQENVSYPTAIGKRIPWQKIKSCISIGFRDSAWDAMHFSEKDDTSVKGKKAVRLISEATKNGLFPIPLIDKCDSSLSKEIEIKGQDIIVHVAGQIINIQVKCDYLGGDKKLGGTGYLYLQTHEINPLKKR